MTKLRACIVAGMIGKQVKTAFLNRKVSLLQEQCNVIPEINSKSFITKTILFSNTILYASISN